MLLPVPEEALVAHFVDDQRMGILSACSRGRVGLAVPHVRPLGQGDDLPEGGEG